MREWKAATGTMITYGLAVSDAWASSYHDRAQDGLTQATVAATTDDDRQALALLTNEFDKLNGWSGSALAARQALNGAQFDRTQSLCKYDKPWRNRLAARLSGKHATEREPSATAPVVTNLLEANPQNPWRIAHAPKPLTALDCPQIRPAHGELMRTYSRPDHPHVNNEPMKPPSPNRREQIAWRVGRRPRDRSAGIGSASQAQDHGTGIATWAAAEELLAQIQILHAANAPSWASKIAWRSIRVAPWVFRSPSPAKAARRGCAPLS